MFSEIGFPRGNRKSKEMMMTSKAVKDSSVADFKTVKDSSGQTIVGKPNAISFCHMLIEALDL